MNPERVTSAPRIKRERSVRPAILLSNQQRAFIKAESPLIRNLVEDGMVGVLLRIVIGDCPAHARRTSAELAKAVRTATGYELTLASVLADEFVRVRKLMKARTHVP